MSCKEATLESSCSQYGYFVKQKVLFQPVETDFCKVWLIFSILFEEDLIFRDIPYFQLYAYCTHCLYFRNKKMQLNVLQLKRSLYITFMLYLSKIWWDFSFYQKQKFFLTANNFFLPPKQNWYILCLSERYLGQSK